MNIKLKLLLLLSAIGLGCKTQICGFKEDELTGTFVPMNPSRPSVPCEHVLYLEQIPSNRTFQVIGVITPRGRNTWGETLNAGRAVAAQQGADAVVPISEEKLASWGMSGSSAGRRNYVVLRLQAIAFTDSK